MLAVASCLRCQIAGQGLSALWGIGRAGIRREEEPQVTPCHSCAAQGWDGRTRGEASSREAGWLCVEMFPGWHHWNRHRAPSRNLWEEPSWWCPPGSRRSIGVGAPGEGMWSPRERWRVGRAVAQSKALQTEGWEEAGKGQRFRKTPRNTSVTSAHIQPKGCSFSNESTFHLEPKSIRWGGQEEVTSHLYQQNDAGRRWSNWAQRRWGSRAWVSPWRRRQRVNLTWEVSGMEEVLAPVNAEGEARGR